ncbi:MAG: chlororespiratory reduction protein 7 [Oscillatoriales cyanobacterium SM2_1_8]|nr:chlororespiratory reduction protein 7 [Oscillatoriales cyanobacterium SM2_1_8]
MPDSIMYQEDTYVLLAPDLTEQFVTAVELRSILEGLVAALAPDQVPRDLQGLAPATWVDRLLATACTLDTAEGTWQWYVVRLEKTR